MMLKPISLSILAALVFAAFVQAAEKADETRLDEVEKRGVQVMPFSLEQTTHVFTKTETGGIQQVIAKESSDAEQIKRIREHLSEVSRQFGQGDFSSPEKIHGEEMPGLAELRKAKPDQIKIAYKELANGAQIDYATDDPGLVDAIHRWFDAQLSDHARHAVPGQPHHPMRDH